MVVPWELSLLSLDTSILNFFVNVGQGICVDLACSLYGVWVFEVGLLFVNSVV